MEKHCSTIRFWLKKRTDKNGKSPITMVIAANGERAEFQTGRKIELENWDNGRQQAKGKTTEAKLLNAYLNQLRNKVYLKEIELMQRGFLVTAKLLRDTVIDKVEALNEKPFFKFLRSIMRNRESWLVRVCQRQPIGCLNTPTDY